jgi:hypothetical protein
LRDETSGRTTTPVALHHQNIKGLTMDVQEAIKKKIYEVHAKVKSDITVWSSISFFKGLKEEYNI